MGCVCVYISSMSHLGFQLRNPQHVIMASTRQQSSGLVSRSGHASWVVAVLGPPETTLLKLTQHYSWLSSTKGTAEIGRLLIYLA